MIELNCDNRIYDNVLQASKPVAANEGQKLRAKNAVSAREVVQIGSLDRFNQQSYGVHMLSGEDAAVLPESSREIRYELASRKIAGEVLLPWEEKYLSHLNSKLSDEFEVSASHSLKEAKDFLANLKAVYKK